LSSSGDRPSKLPSGTTSEYGRYVELLSGAPRRGQSRCRPSTGPIFGPHDVLERSDTYLYVPVH
jgi:hypothetical protein